MKASELLREKVGEHALYHDPVMRYIYEYLRHYERHHAEQHADCEERTTEYAKQIMAFMTALPPLDIAKLTRDLDLR